MAMTTEMIVITSAGLMGMTIGIMISEANEIKIGMTLARGLAIAVTIVICKGNVEGY